MALEDEEALIDTEDWRTPDRGLRLHTVCSDDRPGPRLVLDRRQGGHWIGPGRRKTDRLRLTTLHTAS